ncbi:MAG: flagellar filament capping protein FliD [Solirubrobacterales bacterium]
MSGTITITGLSTTLETESIIEKLMEVEKMPKVRLELKEGQVKARETALSSILTKMQSLQTALQNLSSPLLWEETQTVTSSSTSITAELNGGAGAGGYSIEVSQLARAAQKTYAFTESEEASTLTIGGQTIELAAGATLAEAVEKINANKETGVTAVAVGGKLVLSSRTTGAAATIEAEGANISEEASKAKAGLNAIYTVDGVQGEAESNTLTEAIPGVTLTLSATGSASIDVTEMAPNTTEIAAKVKAFVTAYNAAVELIEAKLEEEHVNEPSTQEEANKGVLRGDAALTDLLTEMRMKLSESDLSKLGVTTGAPSTSVSAGSSSVKGLLVFEESTLTALLKSNPTEAKEALSGTNGFVTALEPIVSQTTSVSGGLSERISAATKETAVLREEMTALEERLTLREERLHAQFTAMETALEKTNSESEWLKSELESLE